MACRFALCVCVTAFFVLLSCSAPPDIRSVGQAYLVLAGSNYSLADFPAPFLKDSVADFEIVMPDEPSQMDISAAYALKSSVQGAPDPVAAGQASLSKSMMILGSPCVNSVMRQVLGVSVQNCSYGLEPGISRIRLVQSGSQAGLLIMALAPPDLDKAVYVLSHPIEFPLRGLDASVSGQAGSLGVDQECAGGVLPLSCADGSSKRCLHGALIDDCLSCGCPQGWSCPGALMACAQGLPASHDLLSLPERISGFSLTKGVSVDLAAQAGSLDDAAVFSYDPGLSPPWRVFRPGAPSDLASLSPGRGYVARAGGRRSVNLSLGSPSDWFRLSQQSEQGFYLIGQPGEARGSASSFFERAEGRSLDGVYSLDGAKLDPYAPLEEGMAYWILAGPLLQGQAAPPVPGMPSFHQLYGSLIPYVSTGSIEVEVAGAGHSYPVSDGRFGSSPALIKINGSRGDRILVRFNGSLRADLAFEPMAASSLLINLADAGVSQRASQSIIGLPVGIAEAAYIDDAPIVNRSLSGIHTLSFSRQGRQPTVSAVIDFDSGAVDISRVSIATGEIGRGAASVRGLDLPAGSTKSLRVPIIAGNGYVCIRDSEGAAIGDISENCTGQSEVRLFCDGVYNFGFRCSMEQGSFLVEGLHHSAVAELSHAPAEADYADETPLAAEMASIQQDKGLVVIRNHLNISSSAQDVHLGPRDSVDFLISGEKVIVAHLKDGISNASFKSLPSGDVFDLVQGVQSIFDLDRDSSPDTELSLISIEGSNVTIGVRLAPPGAPVSAAHPAQVPSVQEGVWQQVPSLAAPTPIKTQAPVAAPMMPSRDVEAIPEMPRAGLFPVAPVPEMPSQVADQQSGSFALAVAFAQANPWVIPALSVTLLVVLGVLAYAAYLLYKELQAIKEITVYINQTLSQGFTLPQIMAALRQSRWSEAHISKSLRKVASGYVQVALKQGKGAQVIKQELDSRAWPSEIVDRVVPKR